MIESRDLQSPTPAKNVIHCSGIALALQGSNACLHIVATKQENCSIYCSYVYIHAINSHCDLHIHIQIVPCLMTARSYDPTLPLRAAVFTKMLCMVVQLSLASRVRLWLVAVSKPPSRYWPLRACGSQSEADSADRVARVVTSSGRYKSAFCYTKHLCKHCHL